MGLKKLFYHNLNNDNFLVLKIILPITGKCPEIIGLLFENILWSPTTKFNNRKERVIMVSNIILYKVI